jgi:excisionase family DNA binding protein
MNEETNLFLSSEQAAEHLGVDRATVVSLVRQEKLAGKYFGSHLRVRQSWLKDWLCSPRDPSWFSCDGDLQQEIEAYEARVKVALLAGAIHVSQIPPPGADVDVLPIELAIKDNVPSDPTHGRNILGITFLTVDGIAAELDVSRVVVMGWIRRGEMNAKKIGKSWMVPRLWLSEFVETPDSGPSPKGDINLAARRARLRLVREQKPAKRKPPTVTTPLQDSADAPRRKRGRPRKHSPMSGDLPSSEEAGGVHQQGPQGPEGKTI